MDRYDRGVSPDSLSLTDKESGLVQTVGGLPRCRNVRSSKVDRHHVDSTKILLRTAQTRTKFLASLQA